MKRCLGMVIPLLMVLGLGNAKGEPVLLGAQALVEQVKALGGDQNKDTEPSAADLKQKALVADIRAFDAGQTNLTPVVAATQWMVLFDRFCQLSANDPMNSSRSFDWGETFDPREEDDEGGVASIQMLIAVLPGPDSWEELQRRVKERKDNTDVDRKRNAGLRIFAALLRGQLDTVEADIKALQKTSANLSLQMYQGVEVYDYQTEQLRAAIRRTVGFSNKTAVVEDYRKTIQSVKAKVGQPVKIQVPDLCNLTTEAEVRELLVKSLKTPGVELVVPAGGRTLKLLKQVLMEEMPQMDRPMWSLVNSAQDVELYEAIEKKFPEQNTVSTLVNSLFMQKGPSSYDYDQNRRWAARQNYVLGLIVRGRIEEAVKFAELDKNMIKAGRHELRDLPTGFTDSEMSVNLFKFLDRMLGKNADSAAWNAYVSSALMSHQAEFALTRLDEILQPENLERFDRFFLLEKKAALNFGMGRNEAGIDALREMIRMDTAGLEKQLSQRMRVSIQGTLEKLASIGALLERPDLVNESVAAMNASSTNTGATAEYDEGWWMKQRLVEVLIRQGRYADAEKTVLDSMREVYARHRRMAGTRDSFVRTGGENLMDMSAQLEALVIIYDKSGRAEDVLYLLTSVPWWNMPVLAAHPRIIGPVARALAARGDKEVAVSLLKQWVLTSPGEDEAYRELVALRPEGLLPWMDVLYARDRFEERPLIWKAVLLKNGGQWEAAETTIRQALKVDPTDGESEAGSRVFAYQVLAEVLEARQKTDDAAFFRKVVRSVRTAEKGDQFAEAGLISRSLELYEEAERDFVDAYCVQWRLAERLHELGRTEEAQKHYEIAFERMPEQFGQVASFCFGCNGVFKGEQSRSAAERILSRLVIERPDNPQVHYLMGQLRQAQGEHSQAYQHFRRAVEVDPDYLDAWEKLYSLRDTLFLPKAESDNMAIRGLQLDPLQRHFSPGRQISDIRAMWKVLERNRALVIKVPQESFEMTAANEALDKMQGKRGSSGRQRHGPFRPYRGYGMSVNPPTPGQELLRHEVVQELLPLLQSQP